MQERREKAETKYYLCYTTRMNVQIVNNGLKTFFEERVQLSQEKKNEAINYWKPIVNAIVDYVCKSDDRFSSLLRIGTGSYYEKVQVNKEPYEFDVMLVINNFEVRNISDTTAAIMNFMTDHNETGPPLGR